MSAKVAWDTHSVFPALHSWSAGRSLSRLEPRDLLYTCTGMETGESGCLKTLCIESSQSSSREDKCTFGHLPNKNSTLSHSWDIADSLLGPSAQRVTTLRFTCNLSEAVPLSPRDSGLPRPLADRAEAQERNPWWTVATNRGPIAFDTVTAMELAFGINSRLAALLLSPFLATGLLHWRFKGIDHLVLRARLPSKHTLTKNEAACASYWLAQPSRLQALEATTKSLMGSGPLRMPRELDNITCDASGIFVNGMVFVQAFALVARKATFPCDWDTLVLIDNAQTLHGEIFESAQEHSEADIKQPQFIRRLLTQQQVQAALDSRNAASSISSELPASDFELLPDDVFSRYPDALKTEASISTPQTAKLQRLSARDACEMLLEECGRTHKLLLQALNLHSAHIRPRKAELDALWEACSLTRVKVTQIQDRLQPPVKAATTPEGEGA